MPLRAYIVDSHFDVTIYEPIYKDGSLSYEIAKRKSLICYKKTGSNWEFDSFLISDSNGKLWIVDYDGIKAGVYDYSCKTEYHKPWETMRNCVEAKPFTAAHNLKINSAVDASWQTRSGDLFTTRFKERTDYLLVPFPTNFFNRDTVEFTPFEDKAEYDNYIENTYVKANAPVEWAENALRDTDQMLTQDSTEDDLSLFSKSGTIISPYRARYPHLNAVIFPTLPIRVSHLTMILRVINIESRQYGKIMGYNDQTISLMAMTKELFNGMDKYGANDNNRINADTKEDVYRVIQSVFDDMIFDVTANGQDLEGDDGRTYESVEQKHKEIMEGLCDCMQKTLENPLILRTLQSLTELAKTHTTAEELNKRIPFLDLCRKEVPSRVFSESFSVLSLHPQQDKAAQFYKKALFPLVVNQAFKLEEGQLSFLKEVMGKEMLQTVFPFVPEEYMEQSEQELAEFMQVSLDDDIIDLLNNNCELAVTKGAVESDEPVEDEYAGLSLLKAYNSSILKDVWVNQWGTPSTLACILQTYSKISLHFDKKAELARRAFELRNAEFLRLNMLLGKVVLPVKFGKLTPQTSYMTKVREWLEKRYDGSGSGDYDAPETINNVLSSFGLVTSLIMFAGLIRKIENNQANGEADGKDLEYIRDSYVIVCQFGTSMSGLLNSSKTLADSINYKLLESSFLTITSPVNNFMALSNLYSKTCDYYKKGSTKVFVLTLFKLHFQGYLTAVSTYKAFRTLQIYKKVFFNRVQKETIMRLARARVKGQLAKEGAEEVTEAVIKAAANRLARRMAATGTRIAAKHTMASWTNAVVPVLVVLLILDIIDIVYNLYKGWKLKNDLERYSTFKFLFSLASTIDTRLRNGDLIRYNGKYSKVPTLICDEKGKEKEYVVASVEDMEITWERVHDFLTADSAFFPRFFTLFADDKVQNIIQNMKQGNIEGSDGAMALHNTGLFTQEMILELTGIDGVVFENNITSGANGVRMRVTEYLVDSEKDRNEFHKEIIMEFMDEGAVVGGVLDNNTLVAGSVANSDYGSSITISNGVIMLSQAEQASETVLLWYSDGTLFIPEYAAEHNYPPKNWETCRSGGLAIAPSGYWENINSADDLEISWNYPGNSAAAPFMSLECDDFDKSVNISQGDVILVCSFIENDDEESVKEYQMFRVTAVDPDQDGLIRLEWKFDKRPQGFQVR